MSSTRFATSLTCLSALALFATLPACGLPVYTSWQTTDAETEGGVGTDGTDGTDGTETGDPMWPEEDAYYDVRASVEQIHVWNAESGTELVVVDGNGAEVASGVVDEWSGLVFRELAPGDGYFVQGRDGSDREGPLTVMGVEDSLPDPSFYSSQRLEPGYNYLTTRDGTTLAVYVTLPGPPEDGPYPTIVNYSGYSPARPGAPLNENDLPDPFDLETLCLDVPILCDMPDHPSGIIGGLMGFATVGVNMRGTGCSGGAYDFFETMQVLDGYDLVEVVAAQDWVLNNKVAMAGLSYPGMSQMWVAQTRPPGLAAISPLSVIANVATSTLVPGGIVNDGFALNWADNVVNRASPYGQGWEQGLVDDGDTICEENQLLHGQKVDAVEKALMFPFYDAEIADPLNPTKFVGQINVPVFTAGAWQDEQTGGHFPALWDKFTSAPIVRYNGYNGVHADGYTPDILIEWNNFLSFYLTGEIPEVPTVVRTLAPLLFGEFFGAQLEIPPDRFLMYSSFDEALAAYEAEEPVRIIFEAGGHPDHGPGLPVKAFEASFPEWPIPDLDPERLWLQPDGGLASSEPGPDGGASSWLHDPLAGDVTVLPGGGINDALPPWSWPQYGEGSAAVFLSAPLAEDKVMVGPASADLWIKSTAEEADLEVTISEVRPDNTEIYVQTGWLRASHRVLDEEASTDLRPVQTHLEEDYAPLTPGEWTPVRVEVFPFAHVFRAGSQIRVAVDDPGGTRAEWEFMLHDFGDEDVIHTVGHDAEHPSSVLLPVLPGIPVPHDEPPPCPSLRGQPCHEFVAYENTPE